MPLDVSEKLRDAVIRERLIETAQRLVAVPSPTGDAGQAANCLAELLQAEGFTVERPIADHAAAPAVVVRFDSGRPGRTLQFHGHLDTVHLPFVPPAIIDGNLTGSGASDMKGGLAAAVEALLVLRDTASLTGGAVLFVAHDLHEAPWGLGQQLNALIANGVHGDAVLIPEPLSGALPTAGRGSATWKVTLRRAGAPVHEVMRSQDEPSVINAGAELISTLARLSERLAQQKHPVADCETVFVGQVHSGEIYNQYPQECWLEGTRRWLPETDVVAVEREFRAVVADVAARTGTTAHIEWRPVRGAFMLDTNDPLVTTFQRAFVEQCGQPLARGAKPFVDDGNSFWALARVPAITHGPRAGGQHTVNEWVSIDDLVRVAHLYALVATLYCPAVPEESGSA
ncbi:MAG TPA: M20/M25/M40 family metallo-hydrolase [Pirellulales bacterium]|jgi:acetylornithine deacetylase/succinyl-diaminopimelate desuccinylase-like protein